MKPSPWQWWKRFFTLLEIPAPDPARLLRRIEIMELNIMLPVRTAVVGFIFYSFVSTPWFGQTLSTLDVTVEAVQYIFWFYVLASGALAALLLNLRRLPLAVVQWTVVTSSLVDGLFVAGMTLITGGLDSFLFWLFIPLIVRNALSVPLGFSQLFLNVAISLCYALAIALDISVVRDLDEYTQRALELTPHEDWGEPFVLRLTVLLLTTICCYGTQVLWERQRLAVGGSGGICRARGTIAFRRAARRRVRPPDQKPAGHHQQCRLFAATRPARRQNGSGPANRDHPGGGHARRPGHHANHGLRPIE